MKLKSQTLCIKRGEGSWNRLICWKDKTLISIPGMRYHCIGNGPGGASESNGLLYFVWIQKDNHLNLIEEV